MAYEELVSQGWAESIERKGVFVLSKLPLLAKTALPAANKADGSHHAFQWTNHFQHVVLSKSLQKTTLAIDDGFPDVRLAPVDQLMREYRSISRKFYGKGFLKYGSAKGSDKLRTAISRSLSDTRGVMTSPDQILVTKGSQMGIYLAAQLLLHPADYIAVGLSNYRLADDVFRHACANLLRIPVDDKGLDVDHLEEILQHKKVKAVYVIPHHHLPTTVTLSSERRLKLLALSKKHRFAIIEDDYDFDFHYDNKPYLPLASIDHNQNVIYIGSISKTFAPALRIGFMVGPPAFIEAAASLRELIDRQGDTLMEESFAVMFDNGEVDRHFRKSLKIYKQRRSLLSNPPDQFHTGNKIHHSRRRPGRMVNVSRKNRSHENIRSSLKERPLHRQRRFLQERKLFHQRTKNGLCLTRRTRNRKSPDNPKKDHSITALGHPLFQIGVLDANDTTLGL